MTKKFFIRIGTGMAASVLGLLTVAVASFFLTGYIFDRPNYYTWPKGTTPVALPTSLIFMGLGSAIFLLANRRNIESRFEEEDEHRLAAIERAIRELPCQAVNCQVVPPVTLKVKAL